MIGRGKHMLVACYFGAWLAAVGGCQKQDGALEHSIGAGAGAVGSGVFGHQVNK